MDPADLKLFQTVCFLTLMQHGKGLTSKAPKYIREKMKTSEELVGAWNMLDGEGQAFVCDWANEWEFPLAECLEEMSKRRVSL